MSDALEPFYVLDGERLVATASTRGPWSSRHQHGGPPAALCARALEQLLAAGTMLTRLTFDFIRPVPIGPLAVRAEVIRAGERVQRLRAVLRDGDGAEMVHVTAVALRTAPALAAPFVEAGDAPPPPEAGTPFTVPFFTDPAGYHHAVEARAVRGTWGMGSMAAWLRSRVPLVAGESPSPLQRLLIVADSASGVAVVLDQKRHSWVNADSP
jgi:hypothetical protein